MDSPLPIDSTDSADCADKTAFRIQVAAVVAQQAAVTEQEIELGEVHDLILRRVDDLLEDFREAELRLMDREVRLTQSEMHLADLARTCSESADELRERLADLSDKRRLLQIVADGLAGAEAQIEQLQSSLARMSRLFEPTTPTLRAFAA